jgi:hypothetical protein
MVWTALALACIVLAFVGEIVDERLLLGTLEWFVSGGNSLPVRIPALPPSA